MNPGKIAAGVRTKPRLKSSRGLRATPAVIQPTPAKEQPTPRQNSSRGPRLYSSRHNTGHLKPDIEDRSSNTGERERDAPPSENLFSEEDASKKKQPRGNSPSRGKSETPPGFDEFWAAYPVRRARGDAERAYAKALDAGATQQDLLLGAMRYAAERDREPDPATRAKFTAHAATWLNRGSWADEPTPAPSNGFPNGGGHHAQAGPTHRPSALEIIACRRGLA